MKKSVNNKDFLQVNSEISFFIRTKQYSKALAVIEEQLSINYDPYLLVFKAHIILVSSNNDEEKNKEAEALLNNVLSDYSISFPTKKYALTEMARLASMRKDTLKSLNLYQQILDESKFIEPTVRCKMAAIYCNLDMYNYGLAVLGVEGFNNQAMNNVRCRIYIAQKQFKEALDALKKPVNTDNYPKDAGDINIHKVENEKNYYLGCIYHSYYNDIDGAIKYFELAIKDDNKGDTFYWPSINGLISIYYSNLQYDKCEDLCKIFLAEAPKSLTSYRRVIKTLVRLYIEKEEYDKAEVVAKKYQCDDLELFTKACLKISNFEFIEAYELLDKIYTNDDGLDIEILFRKMVCLFRLNRVDEFDKIYEYFKISSVVSKHMNVEAKSMRCYLLKHNFDLKTDEIDNYYGRQIKNYSEEEFRKYFDETFKSKFNKELDFNELLENTKKQIENMKPLCNGLYDLYIINCRNVAVTKDGKTIHNIIVKCLPDTKDIVLLLPSDYQRDEYETMGVSSKQKKLSQIEKFNKRYGI